MDFAIVVVSNLDGKKYKMVMKGDVAMLSVDKIKRYLHEATKLEPARQVLRFNNVAVHDGMLGAQIGLYDGAVMFLDLAVTPAPLPVSSMMAVPQHYPGLQQHQMQTPQHHSSSQNVSAMTIAPSPIAAGGRGGSIGTNVVDFAARPVYVDHRMAAPTQMEREQRQRSEERRHQLERDLDSELSKLREMQRQVEGERSDMLRREGERLQQLRSREEDLEREAEHVRDERRRIDVVKASTEQDATRRLRDADNLSRRQQQEIEALQRELVQARSEAAAAARAAALPPVKLSPEECVARSLDILAQDFRLPRLVLDANYTCIINLTGEKVNLLVTFDPNTQRLFLYSTILSALPSDPSVALRLYAVVLEGALLGRDMAGGGIGISAKNNLLLMSTSLDMRHVEEQALIAVARPFVTAVQKWIEIVNSILRSSGLSP